jgi:hypothetical protein
MRGRFVHGDHSNTQFATLALWIAQRHGVDARPAFSRVEEHFRATQGKDGSWGYTTGSASARTPGTCAGLLGLAVGHGIDEGTGRDARVRSRLVDDPAVAAALGFLDTKVAAARGTTALDGIDTLYTLWSLERTASVYGLERIGNREWYPWAAGWLVATQHANGSWTNNLGVEVDTCFALLVLRRCDLAPDLTRSLRGPGATRVATGSADSASRIDRTSPLPGQAESSSRTTPDGRQTVPQQGQETVSQQRVVIPPAPPAERPLIKALLQPEAITPLEKSKPPQ